MYNLSFLSILRIVRKKERKHTAIIENIDTEFKELERDTNRIPETVSKTLVAFLNTEGGELYIGIRDDGSTSGVQDADDTSNRLSSIIHDAILPDASPFVSIRTVGMERKNVVKVTVMVGTERPYYLARFGLKPGGVFTRPGNACVPMNESGIRNLMLETSGTSFEECRNFEQNLTFITMQKEMDIRQLEFGQSQMETLKMIGNDKLYTNVAMLLSDQCTYTCKVAVFQGRDNSVFRDRKEFSGSLLKQLNEVYEYLNNYNKTKASFTGLLREDSLDYPQDAIREALLNCLIHRDYLFSGSTIINVYDDHMEFISLGGLVRGLSMEAILLGASQSRNPNLAAIFYRLHLVESYGTGIRKILRLYEDCPKKPAFKAVEGAFLCILPNRNELVQYSQKQHQTESVVGESLDAEKLAILSLAKQKGSISIREVEDTIGLKTTKAFRLIKELCAEGKLMQQVSGKFTRYIPEER